MGLVTTLTYTFTYTNRVLSALGKALMAVWVSLAAAGEAAGRARAAAELSRLGYVDEARNLMTGKDIDGNLLWAH